LIPNDDQYSLIQLNSVETAYTNDRLTSHLIVTSIRHIQIVIQKTSSLQYKVFDVNVSPFGA